MKRQRPLSPKKNDTNMNLNKMAEASITCRKIFKNVYPNKKN